jgi:hypothetical protein
MDVSVTIRNEIVYMTQSGDYDVGAYLRAVAEILRMPDHVRGMPIIVDARALTTPASSQQLQAVHTGLDGAALQNFRPHRYATVTSAAVGRLQTKLAATFIAERIGNAAPDFELRHFTSVEAAEDWLRAVYRDATALPAEADARVLPRSSEKL